MVTPVSDNRRVGMLLCRKLSDTGGESVRNMSLTKPGFGIWEVFLQHCCHVTAQTPSPSTYVRLVRGALGA